MLPLVISLFCDSTASAQEPELAGKKWVIEGIWRGWNALSRDTIILVNRVVPRKHDYFEFFEDSTFHFNYLNRPAASGSIHYQKTLWVPGEWDYNPQTQMLHLHFTDDRTTRIYHLKDMGNNILRSINQPLETDQLRDKE